VSRRLARAPRYPPKPPAIAQFLGLGNGLIAKVRVHSPDRAQDAIGRVAATVDAPAEIAEYAIFGKDLGDGGAPAGSFSPKTSVRLRASKVDML